MKEKTILLSHGSGGEMSRTLIRDLFMKHFGGEILAEATDAAVLELPAGPAVFTTDSPDEARRKIMAAFTGGRPTVREQRELGGNPSNCAVFEYFRALFEPSDRRLEERRLACVSGNLICGECKAELAERAAKFLVEHQRKREAVRDMLDRFMDPAKFGL